MNGLMRHAVTSLLLSQYVLCPSATEAAVSFAYDTSKYRGNYTGAIVGTKYDYAWIAGFVFESSASGSLSYVQALFDGPTSDPIEMYLYNWDDGVGSMLAHSRAQPGISNWVNFVNWQIEASGVPSLVQGQEYLLIASRPFGAQLTSWLTVDDYGLEGPYPSGESLRSGTTAFPDHYSLLSFAAPVATVTVVPLPPAVVPALTILVLLGWTARPTAKRAFA